MAKLNRTKVPKEDPQDTFLNMFPGSHLMVTISNLGIPAVWAQDEMHKVHRHNEAGHDAYFTVNETTNKGIRDEENITKCRAIFLDDDAPRKSPRSIWPIPPSVVVKTSKVGDKGNKYHYYWLTETSDFDMWKKVEESLVAVHNGDPAVKDISRIMRIPCTTNHKTGTKVEVVSALGTIYDFDVLTSKFPPLPEKESKIGEDVEKSDFKLIPAMSLFSSGEHITVPMNSLIMHWAYHYSVDKIKAMVDDMFMQVDEATYEANKDRYSTARNQVDKFIRTAKKKAYPTATLKVVKLTDKITAEILDASEYIQIVPIPKDCLPKVLYDAADEVNRMIRNGINTSILSAMSVTCALLSKNVRILEFGDSDDSTYCSSGLVLGMASGTRKTAAYKYMAKPFKQYEKLLQDNWEEIQHEIAADHTFYVKSIKNVEKEMDKIIKKGGAESSGKSDTKGLRKKLAELNREMAELQTEKPTLYTNDITEQKIARLMNDNQGQMAIITDDGRNAMKNIMGRHEKDGGQADGFLTSGINGDSEYKIHRVGGGKDGGSLEMVIKGPCLNVLIMVQPDLATKFMKSEAYEASGVAARMPVYFHPIDPLQVVSESDRTRVINKDIMDRYYNKMKGLCMQRVDNPLKITVPQSSQVRLNAFNHKFLELLRGPWFGEYSKTNKIVTQAVIYSTVIASLEDPEFTVALRNPELDQSYELNPKYINMGCAYVEAIYSGMVESNNSLNQVNAVGPSDKFARALVKHYDSGKMWEGFINSSHLQNTFASINKDNREDVIQMLVDKKWLLHSRCTADPDDGMPSPGDLNNGFPRGKCQVGDTVYQLNIVGVKNLLRNKRDWDNETNKGIDRRKTHERDEY